MIFSIRKNTKKIQTASKKIYHRQKRSFLLIGVNVFLAGKKHLDKRFPSQGRPLWSPLTCDRNRHLPLTATRARVAARQDRPFSLSSFQGDHKGRPYKRFFVSLSFVSVSPPAHLASQKFSANPPHSAAKTAHCIMVRRSSFVVKNTNNGCRQ